MCLAGQTHRTTNPLSDNSILHSCKPICTPQFTTDYLGTEGIIQLGGHAQSQVEAINVKSLNIKLDGCVFLFLQILLKPTFKVFIKGNVVERRGTKDNKALFIIDCCVGPCHCFFFVAVILFLPAYWSMNDNTPRFVCLIFIWPDLELTNWYLLHAGDGVRGAGALKTTAAAHLFALPQAPTSAARVVRRSARLHNWPPLASRDPETNAGIGAVHCGRRGWGGDRGYIWNLLPWRRWTY